MSYKILEIINWYEKFDKKILRIYGETLTFNIKIKKSEVAHLLGLHYMFKNKMASKQIIKIIKKENLKDRDIFNRIYHSNPSYFKDVRWRIKNLKPFLENLENCRIVEVKTDKNIDLKSDYFLLENNSQKNKHLGIKFSNENGYFETFFVRSDNSYYKNTEINEKIISISEIINSNEEIPFSFNDKMQEKLLDEYLQKILFDTIDIDREEKTFNEFKKNNEKKLMENKNNEKLDLKRENELL